MHIIVMIKREYVMFLRLPKLKNKLKEYQGINLDTIQQLVVDKKVKKEIDLTQFVNLRLAGKNDLVKILGRGKISAALKITAHKFTASAKAAIEAAGGEVIDA